MNFLMLRSNQTAASEHSPAREVQSEPNHASKQSTTLEGLIAEEPFTESEKRDGEGDEYGNVDDDLADANEKTNSQFVANHIDVKEDEGWITIPKESKLFFKQPTSWRPRISRDLLISVASEMTKQTLGSFEGGAQLPVQVLTLQASNLTSQDLTMTILAPASITSPPSVVSLSTSPTSPMSPFIGSSDFTERVSIDKKISAAQSNSLISVNQVPEGKNLSQSVSFSERATLIPDLLPSGDLGCTHLWLQSRVPLGCVPAQSTATIKLEVLPLTDGIITLDSLQIDVKEQGVTYVPEHSLKINATSSISTGII